jgi:hypothetical protein
MKRNSLYPILCVLLVIICICGCSSQKVKEALPTVSSTPTITSSLTPTPTPTSAPAPAEDTRARGVLEKHFQYLSAKDEEGAKTTISEDKRINMTFQTDRMDYIKVISITYDPSDKPRKQYLVNGRGAVNGTLPENLQIFTVTYEVKYHTEAAQASGTYTDDYILIRKNADTPWLVDDWGHI